MHKIGQLFMAGFEGTSVPDLLKHLLKEEQLGGVILFRRNIESLKQLQGLIAELRDAASGRPILIAVDHEGGRVFRMPAPFTQIPPMEAIGRYAAMHADGEAVAFRIGKMMAAELTEAGFNVNFAPVLDINTNPLNPIIGSRAFAGDRDLVAKLGCAMIRGLSEGGVIACGKHFPGHGDTPEDSHVSLPVLPHTWDRLRWMELVPFREAIACGVPMLMTAHILYGAIDAANPITFSKRAITGLLREEMGYDGVIVTDDLQMGAISQQAGPAEAAVRALAAGCDLALICRDTGAVAEAIARTRDAVQQGLLAPAKLAASAQRVSHLAEKAATPRTFTKSIGSATHKAIIAQLTT